MFPRHQEDLTKSKLKQSQDVAIKRASKIEIPTLTQDSPRPSPSYSKATEGRDNTHEYYTRRERDGMNHRDKREARTNYPQQPGDMHNKTQHTPDHDYKQYERRRIASFD